jgi:hypothetical protein
MEYKEIVSNAVGQEMYLLNDSVKCSECNRETFIIRKTTKDVENENLCDFCVIKYVNIGVFV